MLYSRDDALLQQSCDVLRFAQCKAQIYATDSAVVWVTGHFGHKTLRHQDTLGHFGTDLKTLRHQERGTRHFDTSAVIEEKPGHFDPGQFR